MTVTIELAPDEEARLRQKAAQQGQELDEYVRTIVQQGAAAAPKQANSRADYDPAAAIALLNSFMEGDEQDQRETLEFLRKALDEDRPGQRSIFGKGINPM